MEDNKNNIKIILEADKAIDLLSGDSNGLSDPYFKIPHGQVGVIDLPKKQHKTRWISKTLNPEWKESFVIEFDPMKCSKLRIEVYDYDYIGRNDFLGGGFVTLDWIKQSEIYHEEWSNLQIKEYKKRQKSQSKKLKEELKLINHEKDISGKKIVKTKEIDSKEKFDPNKNIQYALMKQKYFNPKSKMCELQDNCPYYLKGEECPNGAHQISELKFESQINENIKLRKNLISTLDKAPEPIIKKPWVHTGRLISCGMADGSGGGKCICGFCKYRARNYDEGMEKKLRKMAREKNEKILKKRDERIKKQKSEVKK